MERLATNDVMARFNDVRVPMTIDSGAEASIVPHELVRPQDFTGETIKCKGAFDKQVWTDARVASVNIVIGNESFQEKVLAVPVKAWVGLPFISFDIGNKEQMARAQRITEDKNKEVQYLPPQATDGKVQGAVLVSEGEW